MAISAAPTAKTRPLCDLDANDAADAGETTTKRISRRTLDRRLRRLGRKLRTVMIMFDDVAKAAHIDDIATKTKTGRRGSRAGSNARRRLRGKDGRFLAEQSREGVKDENPSPVDGHRHEEAEMTVADKGSRGDGAAGFCEDNDSHRVCALQQIRQKKKKKSWKERICVV